MFSVHDYSYCITERVSDEGRIKYDAKEVTFVLYSELEEDLTSINQISINSEYKIKLDWIRGVALHPTGHSDPIFIFEFEGKPCFQVIHYLIDLLPNIECVSITVSHHNQNSEVINSQYLNQFSIDDFNIDVSYLSDLANERVVISSSFPYELVIQGVRFGSFFEELIPIHNVDSYTFEIPFWFSDYYGVCISSKHIVGGFEYKLMLMGNLGSPGGKYLLTKRGDILSPRVVDTYLMKSLLIHLDADSSDILDYALFESLLKTYREIEFAIDENLDNKGILNFVNEIKKAHPFRISTISFSEKFETRIVSFYSHHEKKIKRIKSAFFLKDFSEIILNKDSTFQLFESGWGCDISIYKPKDKSYGISYSYFYDYQTNESDLVFEKTRFIKFTSPCHSCEKTHECSIVSPYPISKDFFNNVYKKGKSCLIKTNLLNYK